MAHGFGGIRTFGLEPYAEHFAAAGLAVFLFDYRCFGASDGEPRNLINPFRHLTDWKAAIKHVRTLDSVDSTRIGLWGSSFSSGHVIMTASADHDIRAISAQVPFVDPITSVQKMGLRNVMRNVGPALRDLMSIIFKRPPVRIPMAGPPRSVAALNSEDSLPGFERLAPKGEKWDNSCPARIILTMGFYRPMCKARKIKCPALIVCAENDTLIDAKAVKKTADRIPNASFVSLPVGHFDIYFDESFEKVVQQQTDFFVKNLT
jgi:pimeloyl-ACP methyl ester carboxylesterase